MKNIMEIIEKEGMVKKFNYKGYNCVIQRHYEMLHLCGYIAIPLGHKYHEVDYDGIDVSCHGGVDFAQYGIDSEGSHLSENINGGKVWWIGFHCGHFGDLVPRMMHHIPGTLFGNDVYRDMAFVEKELKSIIDQIEKECK